LRFRFATLTANYFVHNGSASVFRFANNTVVTTLQQAVQKTESI